MCEICHRTPCASFCPGYTAPVVWYCDECGGPIEYGDICYRVGNRHYCECCCEEIEAELDDHDDSDIKYDEWRDRQFEGE